jgi:hypothetical protein
MHNPPPLSTEIQNLKTLLGSHLNGANLSAAAIVHITDVLTRLQIKAARLEASNKRWEGLAAREHGDTLAIIDAVNNRDEKVVLFPVIHRHVFHDGPKGVA